MIYHRVGSYGPGRVRISDWDASTLTVDPDGDRVLAQRFIGDILTGPRKPALGLIWLAEPDFSSHAHPLGSPPQLDAIRKSDQTAGLILDAVETARGRGEDILLIAASDHGHQTVSGVIDIEDELIKAGLKDHAGSGDVISTSSGTSALVFVHPDHAGRIAAIGDYLAAQSWADAVFGAERMGEVGQAARFGLAFGVAMAANEEANDYGIPGKSLVAKPSLGKADRMHCGQHGGLARYEQSPFLMISGAGFAAGGARSDTTSAVDIAPTVLAHLGIAHEPLDGQALQAGA
ncbi:MAG: alkaline phosphatase family protein [Hyphomicrobiaceae bacterium]